MVSVAHKDKNTYLSTNHALWFALVIVHFPKIEMEIPFLLTGVPEGNESCNILLNISPKEEKIILLHYIIYIYIINYIIKLYY